MGQRSSSLESLFDMGRRVAIGLCLFLLMGSLVPAPALAAPTCFGKAATIVGTSGKDQLIGTRGDDVIVGLGGPDYIHGKAGDDLICGGPTQGKRFRGQEILVGGPGNDRISGGRGREQTIGGEGHDTLSGGPGRDVLWGNNGNDRLVGGPGYDALYGEAGDDRLIGGRGYDTLFGGLGDDRLVGGNDGRYGDWAFFDKGRGGLPGVVVDLAAGTATGQGSDRLSGIENVLGSRRDDVISGDGGDNWLEGNDGADELAGRGGDDCLSTFYDNDRDVIDGGDGTDAFTAHLACAPQPPANLPIPAPFPGSGVIVDLADGSVTRFGDDSAPDELIGIENVYGTSVNDTLIGDDGPNELYGLNGNDDLRGAGGDDLLDGGNNTDSADGGDGTDSCVNAEAMVACE